MMSIKPVECVAFMLIRDGMILAERRKQTKAIDPGILSIPGGHCDAGETHETTLQRELAEELAVTAVNPRFVCALIRQSTSDRTINYFVVEQWQGEIQNHEADALQWAPLDDLSQLDLYVDRLAVQEYLRLYCQ